MVGQVKLQERHSLPVISVAGRMTVELGGELSDLYESIPVENRRRVLLDLTQTEYINSAGLALLINLVSRAQEKSQTVDLVGVQDSVKRLIEIVGLIEFVTIYPDLHTAAGAA